MQLAQHLQQLEQAIEDVSESSNATPILSNTTSFYNQSAVMQQEEEEVVGDDQYFDAQEILE